MFFSSLHHKHRISQNIMLRCKSLLEIPSESPNGLRRSASSATVDFTDMELITSKERKEINGGKIKRSRSVRFVADQFSSISVQSSESGDLTFKLLPPPDCLVQVMNMIFECNKEILSQYLDVNRFPLCSSVPLIIDTEKIVNPEVFWWIYNWMNAEEGRDDFINIHWALQLYIAGFHLGIQELWESCYEFLMDTEKVTEESAFWILRRVHRYNRPDLQQHFASQIRESFLPLSSSDEFYELFWDEVILIFRSDNIVVSGEVDVLYAAIFWMEEDDERKINYMEQLMSTVRFPLMPVSQLLNIVVEFPELAQNRIIRPWILDAIRISALREMGLESSYQYQEEIPNSRKTSYKPLSQQPLSYDDFLARGRRLRATSRLYEGDALRFDKPRIVKEIRRTWEMEKTKSRMTKNLHPQKSRYARQLSF